VAAAMTVVAQRYARILNIDARGLTEALQLARSVARGGALVPDLTRRTPEPDGVPTRTAALPR